MNTQTEALYTNRYLDTISHGSKEIMQDISKEKWLQKYAVRILNRYLHWQTPLDVASTYAARLREDLAAFYDDPLKRMFIEANY